MLTLLWQVSLILGSCLGAGSWLLFLLPRESSLLSKVFFSSTAGIFLAVLIPQNLIYLGVPVRFSAWILFGLAAFQLGRHRRRLGGWLRSARSNVDLGALGVVILVTVAFHSVVPVQQGIDSYYGKAGIDQINYVFLAEFLKEEPYKTDFQDVGLRPWLLMGLSFKHQRIGQSVVTAEISVLSGTDAKRAYAATFIFFLAALAICLYFLLREIGVNSFTAAAGAILPTIFPGITHLFLYGFLSQVAALFVFVFFAVLLQRRDLNARSFTALFSLGLAYLIAVYSEIAPLGVCCFLLGVLFVRRENFRQKLLILLSGILLAVLFNPFYIYNLIGFLSQQYYLTLHTRSIDKLLPNFLTLRGWSAVLFGAVENPTWILPAEICGAIFALLAITGFLVLPSREKLVFGSVLLPVLVIAAYLSSQVPLPVYPITKLMFSFSPFAAVLAFSAISRLLSPNGNPGLGMSRVFIPVVLLVVAALGSIGEYRLVADPADSALLREPGFINVCRRLELLKNKKVLLFDLDRYILGWLCYHARNNEVYCDARAIGSVDLVRTFPFSVVPKMDSLDLVVSRDRIIDPKTPKAMCGVLIDSLQEPASENGKIRYWLGPPTRVRFLALRAISARVMMRLEPGPDAKMLPISFSLSHDHENVAQGSFSGETVAVPRIEIPRGLSDFELSVSAERVEVRPAGSPLHIAKLDDFKVGDIEAVPDN
jgi:hypothetical protein